MSEWKEYKLGDVVNSNTKSIGKDYPHNIIQYLDTGSITHGKIENFQEFVLADAPSRAKRLVKKNDIVYSTVRPIQRHYGFIVNPPQNLVVSTGFSVIETNPEIAESLFVYYFLTSDEIVETLDVIADGSTSAYPSLKPSDIEKLDILLPPLPAQKAIASILSSLDDKIDLLHRQNETLEAMAETLFRQWFVEEVEDDWEEKVLEKLCTITRGASPRPIISYVVNGTVPWIKIADGSRSNTFFIDSTNEFIIEEGVSKSVKVYPGDLILSNSATCGFPYFVELEGCIHDGWLLFRDFKYISKLFTFFFLKQIFRELNNYADGSVQNNLNTGILKEYPVSVPPINLVAKFDKQAGIFIDKIKRNIYQIRTLEKLRDTLLPKLMSGEVRIEMEKYYG